MTVIDIPNHVDVRNIVINELRKRDKLISKSQLNSVADKKVVSNLKTVYRELEKIRKRLLELENLVKGGNFK